MVFTIGIDPHKGSHLAAVLDEHERFLEELRPGRPDAAGPAVCALDARRPLVDSADFSRTAEVLGD